MLVKFWLGKCWELLECVLYRIKHCNTMLYEKLAYNALYCLISTMKKTLIVTQVCDIRVKEALIVSIKQIDTSVLPVPGNECKWYWSQVQFRSYVVCLYSPCWPVLSRLFQYYLCMYAIIYVSSLLINMNVRSVYIEYDQDMWLYWIVGVDCSL